MEDSGAVAAHQAGYEKARGFVERYGVAPRDDLEGFLREKCDWAPATEPPLVLNGVAGRIKALVGTNAKGKVQLIPSAPSGGLESRRFLLGRALFFAAGQGAAPAARLVSRASSWPQRASRAFAAEVLVPAEELRRRVSDQVSFEEVRDLAKEFLVSEMVIEHQLENHRIARIVDA